MKIVINDCYGGFGVSIEALKELVKRNAKCLETHTLESYYGKDSEDSWKKDFSKYIDLGNGMFGQASGFNIYKEGLLYSLDDYEKSVRIDKDLIEVIEMLGEKANGFCASLNIIEIPDGIEWVIDEYDGMESISESHRSWS